MNTKHILSAFGQTASSTPIRNDVLDAYKAEQVADAQAKIKRNDTIVKLAFGQNPLQKALGINLQFANMNQGLIPYALTSNVALLAYGVSAMIYFNRRKK